MASEDCNRASNNGAQSTSRFGWSLLTLAFVFAAAVAGGAWSHFKHQRAEACHTAEQTLAGIADLKAGEIAAWMKERRGDAELGRNSIAIQELVSNPDNLDARAAARRVTATFQNVYGYDAVAIFDSRGTPVLVVPPDGLRPYADLTDEVQRTLQAQTVGLFDLHRDQPTEPIHLTLLCPIRINGQTNQLADGALLMVVEPRHFLYPLTQSWPIPSQTAETMLERREGNEVVYLNELRFHRDAALPLRLPIDSKTGQLAAMAVQGIEGVFEGADYRGIPVLAATRRIADTPWFMVAKEDQDEIYAPLRKDAWLATTVMALIVLAAMLGLGLLWRQQKLALTRKELAERKQTAEVLRRLNRQVRAISECNEAVIHAEDEIKLLQDICRIVCQQAGYCMAWVGYAEKDDDKTVRPVAWAGAEKGYLAEAKISWADNERGRGPTGTTIRTGKTTYVHDLATDPRAAVWREVILRRGFHSSVGLVLKDENGQPFGALTIYSAEPASFTPDEVRLLEELAGDLAFGITILRVRAERKQVVEAFQKSEERYRGLVNNLQDIIYTVSADGTILFVSPQVQAYGFTVEELISRPFVEFVAPEDRAAALGRVQNTLATGGDELATFRITAKDGRIVWFEEIGRPTRDESGKIVSISGMLRDITERKRIEQERQESEKRFRTLIEKAPTAIGISRNGITVYVNPKYLEMFGFQNGDELIGRPIGEQWSPESRAIIEERARQRSRGLPVATDYEGIGQRKDGSQLPMHVAVTTVELPDGPASLAFLTDITERNRAEAELRASEERFRQVADNIREVFWMTDVAKQRVFYVSPAYEKIWRRSCASLYESPLTWRNAIHPEDRERVRQAALTRQPQGNYDETYRIVRPDGTIRWIHDRAFPVTNPSGEVNRVVGTAEDITERRNLEEQFRQAQKLESIGQLAGGVAHDFNNILAAFMMQLALMQLNPKLNRKMQESLEELMTGAKRAANLTQQLLMFSRRSVLETRSLDLNTVVANLLKMLGRLIGENISLRFDRTEGLPLVEADTGMVEQIIMNLCVNARDAMPNGGSITIGIKPVQVEAEQIRGNVEAKPGRFVCLSVTDTGCGMDEATLKRIFEPFFTTKEAGKGTGLGLATVYGIAAQHQGWVEVDSRVGQGTEFRVFFLASTKIPPKPSDVKKTRLPGGNETILLVEDEAGIRKAAAQNLRQLGYRVIEAASGPEALVAWGAEGLEFDLLLSDMVMPGGITGYQLADNLRKLKPGLKAIICSGYSAELAENGKSAAKDVVLLLKPFQIETLSKTIRNCLDQNKTAGLGEPS